MQTAPRDASVKGEFRTDIQALRGLAVALVVLYHAKLPGLPAGLLGVDIFFVISGYLITGIVARGIASGSFSLRDFYFRRARRLLPAAYVVLAMTIIAAPFFLDTEAMESLRHEVIGAVTFSINVIFWQTAGYFDTAAEMKPLLHFWSLSLEEQYYLLMPVILALTPRQLWIPIVSTLTIVSFAGAVYISTTSPDFAFYLLPPRWWELGIGSLAALTPSSYFRHPIWSWLRLPAILILIGVPFFPTGYPHPGVDALLVCAATLVVLIGHNGSRAEQVLPFRALAVIGGVSYSIYLVHWPVLVFARASWLQEPPYWVMGLCVLIALILSVALNRFVEEPMRHQQISSRRNIVAGMVAASVTILVAPTVIASAASPKQNYSKLLANNYGLDPRCAFSSKRPFKGIAGVCQTTENPRVLVIGDSYAMAWTTALEKKLGAGGLAQATMGACDPLLGMARFPRRAGGPYNRQTAEMCLRFNEAVIKHLKARSDIETVVIAGRFQTLVSANNLFLVRRKGGFDVHEPSLGLAVKGLRNMVRAIRAQGKKVVLLAPPPATGLDLGKCFERRDAGMFTFGLKQADCSLPLRDVRAYRAETNDLLIKVARSAQVQVVDIYDYLCNRFRCLAIIDGVPVFRDTGHLSVAGAELIGQRSKLAEKVLSKAR